jgi:hypothetical protein
MVAAADAAGLAYRSDDPLGFERLPFELLRLGHTQEVRHLMWRPGDPAEITAFRFVAISGQGRNRRVHRYTCATAVLPADLPHLLIGPESMWTAVRRAVGRGDIEVESDVFNRLFSVRGDDERAALAVLDLPMIAWLCEPDGGGAGAVRYELRGQMLLAAVPGHDDPAHLAAFGRQARRFLDHLPDVVLDLYPRSA